MRSYIIISAFLVYGFAYNTDLSEPIESGNDSGCLTDEFHGDFTDEEIKHLVNRRKKVRESINKNLGREELDTLYVPIVFHNIYKIDENDIPNGSYCNFGYSDEYPNMVNDQNICKQRIVRSLEVLNAQYSPIAIQFFLDPSYNQILDATDTGYDGFYIDSTGYSSITAQNIKEHYNKPMALNIYTHKCLPSSTTSCLTSKLGFATYPWSLNDNYPGVFVIHKSLPGSADKYPGYENESYGAKNSQVGILAHEIGHFFSLLHINGIWFLQEGNTQRELVSGVDCDVHGDLICDTPGSPGYVPLSTDPDSSWYFNKINRECIYHGYGGHYNHESDTLKIGGYNLSFDHSDLLDYNYCDLWGFEDYYGLNNNCDVFTNYDNVGDFYGTKDLPEEECLNEDKSEYASECHIDNYNHLPIGNNFMQAGTITLNSCSPRPIGHDDYNSSNHGFTDEQFKNIRTSLELDYTKCNNDEACNTGFSIRKGIEPDMLLRSGGSSCLYPCDKTESVEYYEQFRAGCLITDSSLYEIDFSQYEDGCAENLLSLNQNIIPEFYGINQIYPNPFNPITTIRYGLSQNTDVQISIYDITGRLITTLIDEFQNAGYHSIIFDASDFSSGIYFLKMSVENFTATQKLVLIK